MRPLVIGSVAYDSVETPFGHATDLLGGSATYFSLASALFSPARIVAVVGHDFRSTDTQLFQSRGIDVSGLEQLPGKTFRWGGKYHTNMNIRDTLFTELNVFAEFVPKLSDEHRNAKFVFLANIAPKLQLEVLQQVTAPRFVACDTMNFWINGPQRQDLITLLAKVDCLIINDEEAELLTGVPGVVRAANLILKAGPSIVIIKRGEHGALVFSENDVFYVPAYPLESVIDPTGAGDTFAGGIMGYLAGIGDVSPRTLRQATVVGSLLASFCVEDFGIGALLRVDAEAIAARYRRMAEIVQFEPLPL
ncbi:MAG: sugar kinase [Myxococcales bacterium]|nr:sugar kinase [Myxococcales bacterium]